VFGTSRAQMAIVARSVHNILSVDSYYICIYDVSRLCVRMTVCMSWPGVIEGQMLQAYHECDGEESSRLQQALPRSFMRWPAGLIVRRVMIDDVGRSLSMCSIRNPVSPQPLKILLRRPLHPASLHTPQDSCPLPRLWLASTRDPFPASRIMASPLPHPPNPHHRLT
jgi:hypothetical protein